MKNILKLSLVSLCASGAVFTTQVAQANHDRSASDKDSDKQLVITEPAGADNSGNANFSMNAGAEIRTSNLIGEKVLDSSGKHCGTVRDAIIDLNSGRLAFLVINSRGREIAIPGSEFRAEGNEVTLNISRDRLQNAPAFSYQNLNDQNWVNQTYGYYGQSWQAGGVAMQQPNWQSSGTSYQTGTSYQSSGYQSGTAMQSSTAPSGGFYESSGAQLGGPRMVTGREQDCYADCILHKYQAGKGSARVTDEYYWNNVAPDRVYAQYPGTGNTYQNYAYNSSYNSQSSMPSQSFYSSGSSEQGQVWYGPGGRTYGSSGSAMTSGQNAGIISESAGASAGMNLYRSSDLVGMHIRSSNGQDLGTIRDVVLDLNSGRVAYAVIVPTGGHFGGKYLAVPPAAFTRSGSDQHVLTLNMDEGQLQNAPSFEPNNWPQPQNQTFIGEVYNFYHVSPYWQRGEGNWQQEHRGHMRHHEGTTNEENEQNEHNERNNQGYNNQGTSNQGYSNQGSTSTEQQNLNQGSTQGSIQNQGSSTDQNLNQNQNPNQQPVNEPSGSDVKGAERHESSSSFQNDQSVAGAQSSSSSATSSDELKKGAELHQNNSIKEPSGAEQSSATQPGTSGEQSSTELKSSQNQQGTATSEQNQSQPSTQSSAATTTTNPDQTSTSTSTSSSATTSTENANQGMSDRVSTALRSDSNLSPISGQVQAKDENGKVALTGTVKSEAEKQQIVSKAEEVAGSGNVIDNLQVKSDNSNP